MSSAKGELKIVFNTFGTPTLPPLTGMLHVRGPKLAGGALFSFQTIVSQCYPFIALYFYRTSDIKDKADVDLLKTVFIILASSWFLCVLAFLRVTNKDFWYTIWSTATGWQFTVESYNKSDDPETKMLTIFENHHSFTTSIRDEVITYMHANWAAWVRTNPAWFTPHFIASVDDEFIPGRALKQLNEAAGGAREKLQPTTISSMKEIVITLTTVDTMTDIYMVYLYHENGLHSDANTMIAMIATNTFIQLLIVLAVYNKKGWKTVLKEWFITMLFLRPFVDAWRVHNKHEDSETTTDPLAEMIMNKGIELATESIPGCVLQCYVLLLNPSLGSSR